MSSCKCSLALGGLLSGVLFAMLSIPAVAQPVTQSHTGRTFAAYDAAHEITFEGAVQQVVMKHTANSPAGMHLLVTGARGTIDAHVGSLLSKPTRDALHVGLPVQIVGAVEVINGRPFVLARQLTFGGRTINVRSKTGFLLMSPDVPHRRFTKADRRNNLARGGVR